MSGKLKQKKCLIKGCGTEVHARGLCRSCYASAARYVRLGRTSWDLLVRSRLASERDYSGRKTRAGKFTSAMGSKK